MGPHVAALALLACQFGSVPARAQPEGLIFHASFNGPTAQADFAGGDGRSTFGGNIADRQVEGVDGPALLQKPGDHFSYPIEGNFGTSQGTFSVWVKPLNWDGHSGKFRHFLVANPDPSYVMLAYLYPIGDEAVINYLRLGAKTPTDVTYRAGGPVDILKQDEWTHLATTWGPTEMALYADGKRVGEGLVPAPIPKHETGTFTICPIEFWKHEKWSDPNEQTVCDEVRIFNRPLTDEEILDLYALNAPGGVEGLEPKLVAKLEPDHFAKTLAVDLHAAHLDEGWRRVLADGAQATLTVRDPNGRELLAQGVPLGEGPVTVRVPEWVDGDYVAEADLAAAGRRLSAKATLTKPPTPWLPPQKEWRADRVLEPWTPLQREGKTIRCWGREVTLDGGLPSQIVSLGEPVLAGPIRLRSRTPATWQPPRVTEEQPFRVTVEGQGELDECTVQYQALVEFDGLVRCDLTLTPPEPGIEIGPLTIEIPVRVDVATYYRNPVCVEWDGEAVDEPEFIPYAWLGNEERGLSWFMESDANWRRADDQPAMTLRREGESVVARLHVIDTPVSVQKPLTYAIGFEATPVRPLPDGMYEQRFASGPYTKGANIFVYGWSQQISYLNGRLIAYEPDKQRAFTDKWRAQGIETRSYTCTQCTSNLSPEYLFFGREWNQPYGSAFSGYKRVPDDAPYSMVPVCPRSSFADFLVWCVEEHLRNDWGGGIYTDIDGAKPCDNREHGCGFTDAFGRSGRTWPIYAHRALSRRIYAACHDRGKSYFSHSHSNWYAPFHAFNDGWCPGEQYSHAAADDPAFYMDGIPDRVWRSEFYSPTNGVVTFLLPELGRLAPEGALDDPGPSECCIAAAMCYGVPLWAGSINKEVVEEVWAVQHEFGMASAQFVPFWEQDEFVASNPDVRVSLWRKPGARLLVVTNFTDDERSVELNPAAATPNLAFAAAWKADDLSTAEGSARLTVPAKRGALLKVTGIED